MKVKTFLIESHSSMRGEKKNIQVRIDEVVGDFLSQNKGISIRGYAVSADAPAGSRQSAVVSIIYADEQQNSAKR